MKKISKEKIKTWIVTGASSGIGYNLCLELLNRGYNVVALARRIPKIEHKNALCLSVDVTNPEEINSAIGLSIQRFKTIDVLINNAGKTRNVTIEEENLENVKEIMNVNFFGTFNMIHSLLPHFRQNKNGTIINNSSQSGVAPRTLGCAYCASKHAIEAITGVCLLETIKFCRVMSFELGWFPSTDLAKNMIYKTSEISEYKNIPSYFKPIYPTHNNDLDVAVKLLIDKVEEKKLPRRFVLGRDAYIKLKSEGKLLLKDLMLSKKSSLMCSKLRPDIIPVVRKFVFNKLAN